MNITELANDLQAIDIAMVAVTNGVSTRYVEMLLSGDREVNSERSKKIVTEYEILAQDNLTFLIAKADTIGLAVTIK